jgi:putative ABC transport system ATP-binding protein
MIRMKQISKTYRNGKIHVPVLKDINLQIETGEYVSIMGPSGSGKTTLMNLIGCLDQPTKGDYWLNGTQVSQLGEKELSKIRNQWIGFIFQQFYLLPRLNILQNVELPLIYAGVSPEERKKRATTALARVGLDAFLHHQATELSGGQQQRVAIARALVTEPSVLLADEPTGSLDSEASQLILDLFDQFHQEGRTILVITHDHEVAQRAQRQILLKNGRIDEEFHKGAQSL